MYIHRLFSFLILIIFISCKKESDVNNIANPFADEPPINSYLAASSWPITHCNAYAQASSPYPGPDAISGNVNRDFKSGTPGLITVVISGLYPDSNRVLWVGNATDIAKVIDTGNRLSIVATKKKEDVLLTDIFSLESGTSGAYTFIDKENIFYSPRGNKIYAYSDAVQNDPFSGIQLLRTYTIPSNLTTSNERIVGMTLTYDGNIVFATNNGLVGLINRSFTNLKYIQFAGEEISNSISCDEENGIYVVTSKKMYRVQWTGTTLSTEESEGGWISDYETGNASGGIRLGDGSGSTPTLMGFGNQDKFIVITDGQDLMNLVLMWRDKIPDNWIQIPGTKSRRIAAQVPIKFGNPSATRSLSEQSVCVRGYGAMVVNNELKNGSDNRALNIVLSGLPQNAPYGVEKLEWNPSSRKLNTVWVNKAVSFPSGIPCMSSATNLAYCIGQKNGIWNFTAINWSNGQIVFEYPLGNDLKYNSAYAATEIGMNRGLLSGTLFGLTGIWQKK